VEYYGAATPDLAGIRVVKGDYETKKLSKACIKLVGDAVDNWLRLASDRHTITFAVDIAHCEALAERYRHVGIAAAALHTGLDQVERDNIVAAFKAGQIQVLVNVSIASYGFDDPTVNCIQGCRPTKSIVLHLQMMGRGMRPAMGEDGLPIKDRNHPDFKTCLMLDHTQNVRDLGFADDLFRWTLDEGRKAGTRVNEKGEAEDPKPHTCEDCGNIFSQSRVCPKCGWKVPFSKRDVEAIDADLVPIGKIMVKRLPEGWPSHEVFYGMLRYFCANHEPKPYSPMWAVHKFEEKAECRPPNSWNNQAMVPPNERVRNWIKSRQIANAKRWQKEQAGASR